MIRPLTIIEKGELLKDAVLASSDGLITTFAVVAGAQGAHLGSRIVLIIGIGNLIADGFSMAAGSYIGAKSKKEFESFENNRKYKFNKVLFAHAFASFIPFVLIGSIPLFPFLLGIPDAFKISLIAMLLTLFFVGCFRSFFTKRKMVLSGFESLLIGGIAASTAYVIGYLIERYSS